MKYKTKYQRLKKYCFDEDFDGIKELITEVPLVYNNTTLLRDLSHKRKNNVLKYIIQESDSFDNRLSIMKSSVVYGNFFMVKYLIDNYLKEFHFSSLSLSIIEHIGFYIREPNIKMLELLLSHGANFSYLTPVLLKEICEKNKKLLSFIIKHDMKINSLKEVMNSLTKNEKSKILSATL